MPNSKKPQQQIDRINIRPGVSMLWVLAHLPYKSWFALAEFVDNAVGSYLDDLAAIRLIDGKKSVLKVSIDMNTADSGSIVIRDNAGGIHYQNYERAFRPAELPPNRDGLSEFGMGMKSAACWFAPKWSVRTSAIGEPYERIVKFDIDKIVMDNIEELAVKTRAAKPDSHYTEISLTELGDKLPQGKSVAKIKEHLASIYQLFIKQEILELSVNGDVLSVSEPKILNAPHYRKLDGPSVEWRKDFKFRFGGGFVATGFAGIRAVSNINTSGFAVFRRNRLIIGGAAEPWRPKSIFGQGNTFKSQRLFGEIHLDGVPVSHTKDELKWNENEEEFLQELKRNLDSEPMPLLKQAEHHRVTTGSGRAASSGANRAASKRPQTEVEKDRNKKSTAAHDNEEPQPKARDNSAHVQENAPATRQQESKSENTTFEIELELNQRHWHLNIILEREHSAADWMTFEYHPAQKPKQADRIDVKVFAKSRFVEGILESEIDPEESVIRLAAAFAIAHSIARTTGGKLGTLQRTFSDALNELS